jgi:hypothetical protein
MKQSANNQSERAPDAGLLPVQKALIGLLAVTIQFSFRSGIIMACAPCGFGNESFMKIYPSAVLVDGMFEKPNNEEKNHG